MDATVQPHCGEKEKEQVTLSAAKLGWPFSGGEDNNGEKETYNATGCM